MTERSPSLLPHECPPSDNTTLTAVVNGYDVGGFDAHFSVTPEGLVRCYSCEAVLAPESVPMHSLRRMEGASDPDDMLAVLALTCPHCGERGTLVLNYGPGASAAVAAVLIAVQDHRDGEIVPRSASPGEAPTLNVSPVVGV